MEVENPTQENNTNQGIQENNQAPVSKQNGFLLPILYVVFLVLVIIGIALVIPMPSYNSGPCLMVVGAKCPGWVLGDTLWKRLIRSSRFTPKLQPQAPVATSQTTQSTLSPSDQTANWKIYTSSKYGYSIKYPPQVSVDENGRFNFNIQNDSYFIGILPSTTPGTSLYELNPSTIEQVVTSECPGSGSQKSCSDSKTSPIPNSVQFDLLNRHYASTNTIIKNGNVIYQIDLSINNPNIPISAEAKQVYNQMLSTFKFIDSNDNKNLAGIKSLDFENDCMVKITFISKGEITMSPAKEEDKCSHVYPPQVSSDRKYGAVELRLLRQDSKESNLFSANSVFVYFAAQQEWILVNSFGAATISDMTFDTDNNLLITLFYEGKTADKMRIALPKIAEQYDQTVNPKTKELQWQYSDLYIHHL